MKKNKIRLIFSLAFTAITNGYVKGFAKGSIYKGKLKYVCVPGLNCYSCPGALGSCPMGSLQAILSNPSYRISLYVLGLLGMFGTLLGRFVCGWMCPFGLIQELLHKIPVPYKIKNLNGHKVLKYLRYVILTVFVLSIPIIALIGEAKPLFCEYICPSGMIMGSFPLLLVNESLRNMSGGKFFIKLGIFVPMIILSVISYRPFCKYLCPLGAIYGLFNKIALYRYEFNEDKCTKCSACVRACGMDIKVYENINSTECIRCGRCIDACPNDALTTSFDELKRKLKRHEET